MTLIRIFLVLVFVILGLINRHHVNHEHKHEHKSVSTAPAQSSQMAANKEILQNAERLTETLRKCEQTAHKNKETR
jgi:hypothetical protein